MMIGPPSGWPSTAIELEALQRRLAGANPPEWRPDPERELLVAGVFAAGATRRSGPGGVGDPLWTGAALVRAGPGSRGPKLEAVGAWRGRAGAAYVPGLLALRCGPALEHALRELGGSPDVVLVDATGRDHPRRFGLALHLGRVLARPTVGVTDRPLLARAAIPAPERGSFSPLFQDGEPVGALVRTRRGAKPLVVHAGWRTDPDSARALVLLATGRSRTPEAIRQARRVAREARAGDEGRRS